MNQEWAIYEQSSLNEITEVASAGSLQGGIMKVVKLLGEESQEMCQVIAATYQGHKIAARMTSMLNEEAKTYIVCPRKVKFVAERLSKENPPGRLGLSDIIKMLPEEKPKTVH